MQYFLVEITKNTEGQIAKALWDQANMDAALMALHQGIASAMANTNVVQALFEIIDDRGAVYKKEFWARETTEE